MSKYPQSCYIVGVFVGVHPVEIVNSDFSKQKFAIDTEEQFGNIKVFEATKTPNNDLIAALRQFKKGDLVKVQFNVRSNKNPDGKWFTNVTAWKVSLYVKQDTDDFAQPDPADPTPEPNLPSPPVPEAGDDRPF